jgi:ribonuclease Z
MKMPQPVVYFLGTGGASSTRERDNTALLLENSSGLFLIDCPGSVTRKIKLLSLDPRNIRALFITHTHPDHIYGLPSLVHNMMLENIILPVYGSRESLQFAARLLDLFGLRREKIQYRLEFKPLAPDDTFTPLEGMKSRALPVRHKPSSLGLFAAFEPEKVDFLYTGDTAVCPSLFKRFFGTDYLVHDCSVPSRFFRLHPDLPGLHTQSLDLGRLAAQAGIRCLIPIHFFGELDFRIEEIEEEIKSNFKGKLNLPNDLDRLVLKRRISQ